MWTSIYADLFILFLEKYYLAKMGGLCEDIRKKAEEG